MDGDVSEVECAVVVCSGRECGVGKGWRTVAGVGYLHRGTSGQRSAGKWRRTIGVGCGIGGVESGLVRGEVTLQWWDDVWWRASEAH